MNVQIKKHITYRGMAKRVTGYSARLGDVETGTLPTPQEAKDVLVPLVERACYFAFPRTVTIRSHTSFVGCDRGQWYYTAPRDFSQEQDGVRPQPSTIDGHSSAEEATVAALHHVAQNVWDGTAEDGEYLASFLPEHAYDSYGQRAFRSWVEWQLRYKAFRASGLSDSQSHTAASDYRQPVPA